MTPRFSNRRDGSGSLAFPAPSSTFRRCRPGPRGVPFLAAAPTEAGADDPHDLGLLFEALPRALVPPRGRSSSREIRAPLHRHDPVRRLPGASSHRPDSATCRARSALVVSHHLDGLLRTRARGFVAPRSRSGVHRVSERDGAGPVRRRWRTSEPRSRGVVHTLRRVSSSTAGTASLRPFALLPFPALTRPRTHGRSRTARGRSRRTGSRGASEPGRSRSGDPLTWAVVSPR